jgi:hypothetical protein
MRWRGPLAAALALLAFATAAPTATAGELIVVPRPASRSGLSYFTLTLPRGRTARAGTLLVRNTTGRTLTVALDPVSGRTIDTLGSTYEVPGRAAGGVAGWIRLGMRHILLRPRASATVPVGVTAPRGASAGDALAGISVEAADQDRGHVSRHGLAVASVVRYVIGLEVSVPGPRHPELGFTGARLEQTPSALTFLLEARNSGNVVLQNVAGAVTVRQGQRTVLRQPLGPGTFVTKSAIAYPLRAPSEHPRAGTRYRVIAYLRYPGGIARLDTGVAFGAAQAALQQRYSPAHHGSGSSTPIWLIALVAGVAAYGVLMTVLVVRNRRRSAIAA